MKKFIAIIMCLITVITGVAIAAPASLATADGADIPVIHIVGTGEEILRKDENGNVQTLFPFQAPDGYIEEKAEVFLPVFAEVFFTQEWDEFCDVLYDCVMPILSQPALDKNGEISDGSYIAWNWSRDTLPNIQNNGKYSATGYIFEYDWRLSPLTTADVLHQFIEDVLYVTGAEKVALYGRCYGSNVAAAYMYKYNGEHVAEVIHYASALYGATATEVEEKFSDDYISAAVENQTARYISPDCQIDASTCLLPDTTWFIKDLYHKDFPLCVNGLVSDIVNNKNFNVHSNPEYPQFLVYEKDTGLLVPMTSENLNTTERWNVTLFDALIKFFKNLVIILQNISDK